MPNQDGGGTAGATLRSLPKTTASRLRLEATIYTRDGDPCSLKAPNYYKTCINMLEQLEDGRSLSNHRGYDAKKIRKEIRSMLGMSSGVLSTGSSTSKKIQDAEKKFGISNQCVRAVLCLRYRRIVAPHTFDARDRANMKLGRVNLADDYFLRYYGFAPYKHTKRYNWTMDECSTQDGGCQGRDLDGDCVMWEKGYDYHIAK